MQLITKVVDQISDSGTQQSGKLSRIVLDKLTILLDELLHNCDDIAGAIIGSIDGVAWCDRLRIDSDRHRFAAMSSALLALSDSLVEESGIGVTNNVMIEGANGKVFVMHAGNNLLLTVFVNDNVNLGMSLAYSKQTADKISLQMIEAA